MKALIWKRFREFKTSKIRWGLFLLLPIVYLAVLNAYVHSHSAIAAYFCLGVIMLNQLVHWNIEDIIHGEALLSTPLTPYAIWLSNAVLVTVTGYLYGCFILAAYMTGYSVVMNRPYVEGVFPILLNLSTFLLGFALVVIASIHYVDFSKIKQYATSIFGILNLVFPFVLLFYGDLFPVDGQVVVVYLIAAVVLFSAAYLLVRKAKRETLVINIAKLSEAYDNQLLDD